MTTTVGRTTTPLKRQAATVASPTQRSGIRFLLRDLLRKREAQIGGLIVLALLLAALFAPWIAPFDPYALNVEDRLQPPNATYWFGTDDLGRDMFSRIIYGARTTIRARRSRPAWS
jgi:ABC-type dipeptide/oligopeptide/nickel transport system permease subunit